MEKKTKTLLWAIAVCILILAIKPMKVKNIGNIEREEIVEE